MKKTQRLSRAAARRLMAWTLCGTAALAAGASAHAGRVCDVKAYGARGDGSAKDTHAIQSAIDACASQGGGTVRLTPGTYLTGPIVLKSHTTLDVQAGATLLGSQDKTDYPPMQELREPAVQPLIGATHAEDITIRGGGTIDGAGQPWWADVYSHRHLPDFSPALRPRLILLDHCKHALIEGVTMQNSASWQVVLYYSSDVTIRNGKILSAVRSPNTDGIDPFSSHHITIAHMTIDTGDDNIAIKSGQPGSPGPDDPSTDITIRDCTLLHGHGMSIGSEIAGGVQRVRASHIHFAGTGNGIRIKSGRDRGGDIGDFDFRDLTMDHVGTPIQITEYYPRIVKNDTAHPVTRLTPRFHDIHIEHLTATGAKEAGVVLGLPESPITTLTLRDVHIQANRGMTVGDATVTAHDLAITAAQGKPATLLDHARIVEK